MRLKCSSIFRLGCTALLVGLQVSCTTPAIRTPTYLSAKPFNIDDYKDRKVVVLPVVVSPAYASAPLPVEPIRSAIARQLSSVPLTSVVEARQSAIKSSLSYPLSPAQLRSVELDEQEVAAVVGISIIGWADKTNYRPASITVVVVFADPNVHDHTWMLVKEWASAKGLADIPNLIASFTSFEFLDVGRYLRKGRRTWLMQPEVVLGGSAHGMMAVSPIDFGPLGAAVDPYKEPAVVKTSKSYINLAVAAFADDGITDVSVDNPSKQFNTVLTRRSSESPRSVAEFFADTVEVPLTEGRNVIRVSVQPTGWPPFQQTTVVFRETPKPAINMVFVSNFVRNESLYAQAQTIRDDLSETVGRGTAWSQPSKVPPATTERVNTGTIQDAIRDLRQEASATDLNILYLTGRLAVFDGQAFFLATDARRDANRFYLSSPPMAELTAASTGFVAVADLCADPHENVRQILGGSLPTNWVVSLRSCDVAARGSLHPMGDALVRLLKAERATGSKEPRTSQWIVQRLIGEPEAIFGAKAIESPK